MWIKKSFYHYSQAFKLHSTHPNGSCWIFLFQCYHRIALPLPRAPLAITSTAEQRVPRDPSKSAVLPPQLPAFSVVSPVVSQAEDNFILAIITNKQCSPPKSASARTIHLPLGGAGWMLTTGWCFGSGTRVGRVWIMMVLAGMPMLAWASGTAGKRGLGCIKGLDAVWPHLFSVLAELFARKEKKSQSWSRRHKIFKQP